MAPRVQPGCATAAPLTIAPPPPPNLCRFGADAACPVRRRHPAPLPRLAHHPASARQRPSRGHRRFRPPVARSPRHPHRRLQALHHRGLCIGGEHPSSQGEPQRQPRLHAPHLHALGSCCSGGRGEGRKKDLSTTQTSENLLSLAQALASRCPRASSIVISHLDLTSCERATRGLKHGIVSPHWPHTGLSSSVCHFPNFLSRCFARAALTVCLLPGDAQLPAT